MIPILRQCQLDLIDDLRKAVASGARIIVVQAPTGAGKTVVTGYIVKQSVLKERKSFIVVHRRRLVDQISGKLSEFEINHGIIMRGEKPYGSHLVQVASRDTIISRCFNNTWNGLPTADLVIVDEGHHAADPKSEYRRMLENYPNAIILIVTATPVGPDGAGLGPWAQKIVCCGPISKLIAEKVLVPVKCFAPDRKKARGGKFKRGIAGDLVESWKTYAENRPTVLFCSRVKHSTDAVESFIQAGIPAAHVDADTTDEERDAIYDSLNTGKVKVVSNVGIIKEGVDIPCLGCCQIYMEMSGRVGFLQAVGRIMRPYPGKEYGIIIDHGGAIFKHGFPDEDTEWTLEGNVDVNFKNKHKDGLTEKALYCKACELLYHGSMQCPQCGRTPAKPPKSIFAPQAIDGSNEVLVEADRQAGAGDFSREEKEKHWWICLRVVANKGGPFTMASAIYKQKYGEYPPKDFPCLPGWDRMRERVADVYPNLLRRKRA